MNSPIRIAFCITDLDPGGAERALVQLVTRLDRRRWEPAVFCLSRPGRLVHVLEQAGIRVTCLGARRTRDFRILFRLRRELRQFQPQILQTFLFHANILGRVAAAWAGVPHCVSGIRVAERRSKWPLRLDRLTDRFVDFHVCVSQAVADFSADVAGLPRARLLVIPNGVDVATYAAADPADRQALGLPEDAYVVLAVGRLDPQKGLHHLFDAARGLLPRFPELHFVLVGDGPLHSELKARAEEAPLTGRIHLTGWRPDVPSLLKMGDALVLPSLWEGMPNVVLEAMAAGLPVVASRVEGVAELVIPEQTGLLVSPGAAGELESAISRLLADPERGRVMGRNGQARVSAHFSWETMVERYVSLYEHLLG